MTWFAHLGLRLRRTFPHNPLPPLSLIFDLLELSELVRGRTEHLDLQPIPEPCVEQGIISRRCRLLALIQELLVSFRHRREIFKTGLQSI